MGLFKFLFNLFFSGKQQSLSGKSASRRRRKPEKITRAKLSPLRFKKSSHDSSTVRTSVSTPADNPPYRFARYDIKTGGFLDLSKDGDSERISSMGLPQFSTPEELANWLDIPVGKLAWLIHRFEETHRPESPKHAHYHFHWIAKRHGGHRLIEAPKSHAKMIQYRIYEEILDRIMLRSAAHGFAAGRSIVTNAMPHVGQYCLLKMDLENFYANVSFSRVISIFRSLGYSREASIWLGHLTTSSLPTNMNFPDKNPGALLPYLRHHLPQGAPTSPVLANLSAYVLDLRLSGLAKAFGVNYTRYADDLTFSGSKDFSNSLSVFITLVKKIIREERFKVHVNKQKIIRKNQRQTVTGVVVNDKINVNRKTYDQIKAILWNCIHSGPESQNRDNHPDFYAHLSGRISHVKQLNKNRGEKLKQLFDQISW